MTRRKKNINEMLPHIEHIDITIPSQNIHIYKGIGRKAA